MPALRQLFTVCKQHSRDSYHLTDKSTRSKRTLRLRSSQADTCVDDTCPIDKLVEVVNKNPGVPDLEIGGTASRRPSMAPRSAGLGSTVCTSPDERLELDLVHHEDEKMSPRETPWATPRVSPRLGSFGSRLEAHAGSHHDASLEIGRSTRSYERGA